MKTKQILTAALAGLMAGPAPASLVPRDRPLRMGVVRFEEQSNRVDAGKSAAGDRRLGRWLENLQDISIEAEPLPPVRKNGAALSAESCEGIGAVISKCHVAMSVSENHDAWKKACADLMPGANRLADQGMCGPEVQKAWVLQSVLAGTENQKVLQSSLITKAVLLHPNGFLATPFEWEKEPQGFDAAKFWGEVKQNKERLVRNCRVDIKDAETFETFYVNGFLMEPSSRLQLHRQGKWLIQAKKGDAVFHGVASCLSPQALRSGLDLKKEDQQWAIKSQLAQVAGERNLDSLLVVQPMRERIRLFLFQSQDSRLLEVPLEKPITLKEWETQRAELTFPIAQEKLVALLNGGLLDVSLSDAAPPLPNSLNTRLGDPQQKWYNNSTFWLVSAGVVAGVATIFLLTQNGQVRPNPSVRLELP